MYGAASVDVNRHGSVSISPQAVDNLAASLVQRGVQQRARAPAPAPRQQSPVATKYEQILRTTQGDRDATFRRLQEEEARSRALAEELSALKARTSATLGHMRTKIAGAKATVAERVSERDAAHARQLEEVRATLEAERRDRITLERAHGDLRSTHGELNRKHVELSNKHGELHEETKRLRQRRIKMRGKKAARKQRAWNDTLRGGDVPVAASSETVLDFKTITSPAPWRTSLRSTLPRDQPPTAAAAPPQHPAASVRVNRHGSVSINQQPQRQSPAPAQQQYQRVSQPPPPPAQRLTQHERGDISAKYARPSRGRSTSPGPRNSRSRGRTHSPAFGSTRGIDRGELPRYHDPKPRESVWMADREGPLGDVAEARREPLSAMERTRSPGVYSSASPRSPGAGDGALPRSPGVYSDGIVTLDGLTNAAASPQRAVTPGGGPSLRVNRHGSISIGSVEEDQLAAYAAAQEAEALRVRAAADEAERQAAAETVAREEAQRQEDVHRRQAEAAARVEAQRQEDAYRRQVEVEATAREEAQRRQAEADTAARKAPRVRVNRHGSVSIGGYSGGVSLPPAAPRAAHAAAPAPYYDSPAVGAADGDSDDSDATVHNIYGDSPSAPAQVNAQLQARINRFGSIDLSPTRGEAPAPAPAMQPPAQLAPAQRLPTSAASAASIMLPQPEAAQPQPSALPNVHIDRNGRITITPNEPGFPSAPAPAPAATQMTSPSRLSPTRSRPGSPAPASLRVGARAFTDLLRGMDIQRAFNELAAAKDVRGIISKENFISAVLMHIDATRAAGINATLLARVFDALATPEKPEAAPANRLASGLCLLCVDDPNSAARAIFDLHDTSRTGIMTKLETERFLGAVYCVASLIDRAFKTAMNGGEARCAKSVATGHFSRLDPTRGYSISFTEFKDWYMSPPTAGEPKHHDSLIPFTDVMGRALALALATASSYATTLTALERAGVGASQAIAAARIASVSMGVAAQTKRQLLPAAASVQYAPSPLQRAMSSAPTTARAPVRSPATAYAPVLSPPNIQVNRHGSISIGAGAYGSPGGSNQFDARAEVAARVEAAEKARAAQVAASRQATARSDALRESLAAESRGIPSLLAKANVRVNRYGSVSIGGDAPQPSSGSPASSVLDLKRAADARASAEARAAATEHARAVADATAQQVLDASRTRSAQMEQMATQATQMRSQVRVNRHGSISINQ
jgi:hypothetical protein